MLQIIFRRIAAFYEKKNRWWLALITGLPFLFCLPPFNHELHPLFSIFPFLTFVALLPLFFFATRPRRGRAILHSYLFAFAVSSGQVFWLTCVKIEGLWVLILIGMVLLAGFVALFYLAAGMAFRWCFRQFPRLYLFVFPAIWILIDYSRTLGELTFPWAFLGYSLTPILPLSQAAAITGVWGLTALIVAANLLVWETGVAVHRGQPVGRRVAGGVLLLLLLGVLALWGLTRLGPSTGERSAKIALIQPNIDQLHWGNNSLEASFDILESMMYAAAGGKPDLIIGPESALLCFPVRQRSHGDRVRGWADSIRTPIIFGAIHWDRSPERSVYDYLVYNTAFLVRPGDRTFDLYRKIKLVPFSEAFPFEVNFPILSRVNLGEADFQRGTEPVIYRIGDAIRAAPFICYEIIFPSFVQTRLRRGANLIVHITNDGWFGRTTGPYQHATMARMRAIENHVAIARCAITGLSMFIDPQGRIISQTKLYERAILEGTLPLRRADTFYSKHGDWMVRLCGILVIVAVAAALLGRVRKWVIEGR